VELFWTAILIIFLSISLSFFGVWFFRRKLSASFTKDNENIAGFFFQVLGVIYGVLIAFAVFVVWNQYEDAKVLVTQEANEVGDLFLMSRAFPNAEHIRMALGNYVTLVIQKEWPTMARGKSSSEVQETLDGLWHIYREVEPVSEAQKQLYSKSLDRLIVLSDTRRLRLNANHDSVPALLSVLLYLGGGITILVAFLFEVKGFRLHSWITAALIAEIILLLFLISAFDHPFRGPASLSFEPFEFVLHRIQTS